MKVNRGVIKRLGGSPVSGLALLEIEDAEKGAVVVPCENGATVRALEAAFGDVIGPGHTVREDGGHIGREIYYTLDEMGLVLGGFTPVEEAPEELVERYERERAAETGEEEGEDAGS